MKKIKTADLALCALFTALSVILSQVMIPFGPVPITLTHLSIFLAAGLLGAKRGCISQITYVLLGSAGVPVFSGLSGGIGSITGPRGGFIISYIVCVSITGLLIDRFGRIMHVLVSSMMIGMIITYIMGFTWYMLVTKSEPVSALLVCVIPFLPGDALKITASAILCKRLYPLLQKST